MKLDIYQPLFAADNAGWRIALEKKLAQVFARPAHGHFSKWRAATQQIPGACTEHIELTAPVIAVGQAGELNPRQHALCIQALQALHPWRKGPFRFFGAHIDSEWRCDKKWARLKTHLTGLQNKKVLDVGCGNGYYMLRMLGAGAKTVIGVDPALLFLAQFTAITQCLKPPLAAYLLPLPFAQLPAQLNDFDYVFSMGVLYHRRHPQAHLRRLLQRVKPGGKVFIETLILDTPASTQLIPQDRYAGMRNVWSIVSPARLLEWLDECGFKNPQLHDLQATSSEEQRSTAWMTNYSLANFLSAQDKSKTIEGYPAPVRAIFSALRPGAS